MAVYPNPSEGNFTIQSKEYLQNSRVYISDITGKIVFEKYYSDKLKRVELNLGLPPGIYFIRIKNNNFWHVKKLIIH